MPKLLSINCATKQTIEFNQETVPTGIFKTPVESSVEITKYGIEKDTIVNTSAHGGVDQALYLYSAEDYAWWIKQLGTPIEFGTFGENLSTEGVELNKLKVGDRLTINNVELEITAPRIPCFKLATRMNNSSFIKQFVKAERPGAYARVVTEGSIQSGDEISLEKTSENYVAIVDIFILWHSKEPDLSIAEQTLHSPISEFQRPKIQAIVDSAKGKQS